MVSSGAGPGASGALAASLPPAPVRGVGHDASVLDRGLIAGRVAGCARIQHRNVSPGSVYRSGRLVQSASVGDGAVGPRVSRRGVRPRVGGEGLQLVVDHVRADLGAQVLRGRVGVLKVNAPVNAALPVLSGHCRETGERAGRVGQRVRVNIERHGVAKVPRQHLDASGARPAVTARVFRVIGSLEKGRPVGVADRAPIVSTCARLRYGRCFCGGIAGAPVRGFSVSTSRARLVGRAVGRPRVPWRCGTGRQVDRGDWPPCVVEVFRIPNGNSAIGQSDVEDREEYPFRSIVSPF